MTSIVFSEDTSMSDICILVQKAWMEKDSEFPIEVKIGPGTFKLQNAVQAKFFSLGIMAYLSAIEEKERWGR